MLLERLIASLIERRAAEENEVLIGQPKDFEAYRYLIGKIKGLTEALELIDELYLKGERNE